MPLDPSGKTSIEKFLHNHLVSNVRMSFLSANFSTGEYEENKIVKFLVGHSGYPDIKMRLNEDNTSIANINEIIYPFSAKDRLNVYGLDALTGVLSSAFQFTAAGVGIGVSALKILAGAACLCSGNVDLGKEIGGDGFKSLGGSALLILSGVGNLSLPFYLVKTPIQSIAYKLSGKNLDEVPDQDAGLIDDRKVAPENLPKDSALNAQNDPSQKARKNHNQLNRNFGDFSSERPKSEQLKVTSFSKIGNIEQGIAK